LIRAHGSHHLLVQSAARNAHRHERIRIPGKNTRRIYGLVAYETGDGRFTTTQKDMNNRTLKRPLTVPKRFL
jgi:hypothetical protein